MIDATDLDAWETSAARRLCRLFRAERGGIEGRKALTVRRLVERRGALIEALIAAEDRRGGGRAAPSPKLVQAFAELALEVDRCRAQATTRVERLRWALRLRLGDRQASGVRGDGGGRLLGRG
jgi:hypothetical protein